MFAAEGPQVRHDGGTVFGIQFSGRFVRQDQLRLLQQGSGNGDSLLFSAGKLIWSMRQSVFQTEATEQFDRFTALFRSNSARQKRDQGVIDSRQVGQQIETLKDKPDLFASKLVSFTRSHSSQRCSGNRNDTAGRFVQGSQQVEQRAFPTP